MSRLVVESLDDLILEKFAEESGQQLADTIGNQKKQLNEAAAVLALSTLLVVPAILKVISMIVKKGAKLFKSKLDKEKNKGEKAADILKEWAEKTEAKFMQPIAWVLKKLGVKDDESKKWAKVIHAIVVVLLGGYSGLEMVDALEAADMGKATAEGMLTALKATETGEAILHGITASNANFARVILKGFK